MWQRQDQIKNSQNTDLAYKDNSTKKNGLRYPRGMNCGLSNLYFENKIQDYDYFLLLTNDTELKGKNYLNILVKIMETNKNRYFITLFKRLGEKNFEKNNLKFFWQHNTAYFVRGRLIQNYLILKKIIISLVCLMVKSEAMERQ